MLNLKRKICIFHLLQPHQVEREAELGECKHDNAPLQFQRMVPNKTESQPEHISLVK